MLLIHCPYCGPRPELEFGYAGQAHVARPADPSTVDADAVGRIPVSAQQHARTACRALAPRARLRAFFQCAARHDDGPFPCDVSRRRADARVARGSAAVTARRVEHGRSHRSVDGRCASRSTDGRTPALPGDTLASALLANGVRVFGRSFKYHRPRGLLAAGSEEPNALVTVIARRRPGARRTCARRRSSSTRASSPRARTAGPSLAFDVHAINDLVAPLLPAAFYYKTFMWPRFAWHRLVRARDPPGRGTGRAPTRPDPDRYAQRYAHCDVLVVGAGPAGLAAALEASADGGARVMLCDEQAEFGGSLLDEPARNDRRPSGAARGSRRRWRRCAPGRTSRCCRARRPSAISRTTWSASTSASPSTWRRRGRRAARAAVAGARRRSRARDRLASSGRWCSRATIGRA